MTPEQRRAAMVQRLTTSGALPVEWRPAFEQVARHDFLPDTIWALSEQAGGRLVPLHRSEHPDEWCDRAYRNAPVDTQVDDGYPREDGTGWEVTSSASQPSVVATMLAALDVRPGMRVLEIGTGTGWNAALLARRLGAENVTTVEIDPELAESARRRLRSAGFGDVHVVTADGARIRRVGDPFDRIVATAGVVSVPYRWVELCRPGGLIVAPLRNSFHPPGLTRLTVRPDGVASGGLGEPMTFMGMRQERVPRPDTEWMGPAESTGTTDVHPHRWIAERDVALAVALQLGDGVHSVYSPRSPADGVLRLLDPGSRSWAAIDTRPPAPYRTEQAGPRKLLDEIDKACRWWEQIGRPRVADWSVRVDARGQDIFLADGVDRAVP